MTQDASSCFFNMLVHCRWGMLSPPAYNTNPQSMTDAQLSQLRANQMQRMQYMEHTIKDALVNSPEEVGELPECYTSILHESMLTSEPKLNYELNTCEMRQLDIVKSAFSCMEEKVEPTKSVAGIVGKEDHTPAEILNIMDVVMRRVVKMAKKLPPFNDLSQDGKLSLLKAAMIDLLCLRGVSKLDTQTQCWNAQALGENALVSMDKMFDKLNDPAQKERYMLFFTTLSTSIRSNMVCMNLFATIVLFDHCQHLVEASDRVVGKRHYETHFNLLRRYLESTIGGEETPTVMATATAALKQLQIISVKAATLFIGKVKAGESESLPMEFFKTTSAEGAEENGEGTPASQETQQPANENT
uniref:NR LBD domain-containing protein n=1 Tax=Ditylenchus dipsaci TaxID=166011 RepID=A0A915CVU0_9BILA